MDREIRPRLTTNEYSLLCKYRSMLKSGMKPFIASNSNEDVRNVLVIPDLHSPFIKYGFLEFCKDIERKYKTNRTIFLGDIIDNHYSSYHETDPDGHSAGSELLKAKKEIYFWHKAFPEAVVLLGNHDLIPARKLMTAGLSSSWLKTIEEVLEVPGWTFKEEYILDNIMYTHGNGRKADKRAQRDLISVVQGHYHSESYIRNFVGENFKIFAMQLGCGIDRRTYGMAYAKHFDKQHLNCGVILENGRLPIIEMMDL